MATSTLAIDLGARITLDTLTKDTQERILQTVERLQETDPATWPADQVIMLADADLHYQVRVPPRYLVFLHRRNPKELEIRGILTEEAVRAWRNQEQRNGARSHETV